MMPFYLSGLDIDEDLRDLTKEEIILAGRPILFGKADGWARKHLLDTVTLLNSKDQARIHAAAVHKCKSNSMGHPHSSIDLKEIQSTYENLDFFRTPPQSVIEECISKFINRTGNTALAMVVCMVCGRSIASSKTREMVVSLIPNRHLLSPHEHHPAHVLTNKMLLEPMAIRNDNGVQKGMFSFFFLVLFNLTKVFWGWFRGSMCWMPWEITRS